MSVVWEEMERSGKEWFFLVGVEWSEDEWDGVGTNRMEQEKDRIIDMSRCGKEWERVGGS